MSNPGQGRPDLPRIPSRTSRPAPELPASFPDLYCRSVRIHAEHKGQWWLQADLVSYDHATDTVLPGDQPRRLVLQDLNAKAAQYPTTVGAAMGMFIHLLGPLQLEAELQSLIERTAEGTDRDSLQAELDAVQDQLRGE